MLLPFQPAVFACPTRYRYGKKPKSIVKRRELCTSKEVDRQEL